MHYTCTKTIDIKYTLIHTDTHSHTRTHDYIDGQMPSAHTHTCTHMNKTHVVYFLYNTAIHKKVSHGGNGVVLL